MLVVLCLSNAARCSIDANFDDAGTGILAASSPVLLGKHSHFCRYRRIASIALRIFLFSNEKRKAFVRMSLQHFSLHLPMGIAVGKGAGLRRGACC